MVISYMSGDRLKVLEHLDAASGLIEQYVESSRLIREGIQHPSYPMTLPDGGNDSSDSDEEPVDQ